MKQYNGNKVFPLCLPKVACKLMALYLQSIANALIEKKNLLFYFELIKTKSIFKSKTKLFEQENWRKNK